MPKKITIALDKYSRNIAGLGEVRRTQIGEAYSDEKGIQSSKYNHQNSVGFLVH